MLNRAALLLRYKQPFIEWINATDQSPRSSPATLAEVNGQERTVYLIEVEDEKELERWLTHHHREVFEEELNGWYIDPALWPEDRSLKVFRDWCTFELHSVVLDFGGSPIEDDELDE